MEWGVRDVRMYLVQAINFPTNDLAFENGARIMRIHRVQETFFQRRILREVKNRRRVSATASSGSKLPIPPFRTFLPQNLGRDWSRTFQIQRPPLTLIPIISPIPRSLRSEQRWVRFLSPRNLSSHQSRNRSSCWIWESI